MSFQLLTLEDRTLWSALIERLDLDSRDIHFLPDYGEIYAKVYGQKPLLAYFETPAGFVIQPYVLRALNDLPFLKGLEKNYFDIAHPYGYGGPVVKAKDPGQASAILAEFEHHLVKEGSKQGWASEFTSVHPLLEGAKYLAAMNMPNWSFQKSVAVIDLTRTVEEIWSGIDKGHRSSIKKAQKKHLRVEKVKPTVDNLAVFQSLYLRTMKRRQAAARWHFPPSFFSQTVECLGPKRTSLFFVYLEEEAVAGYFLIHDFATAYLHFSGAHEDYLKLCPNNLLMYETLRWAKENGYRQYHLGGGVTDLDTDSLLSFKAGFSSTKISLYTYYRVLNSQTYADLSQLKKRFEVASDGHEKASDFFPIYRR